mgnify:CR=1 FL=1
MSTLFFKVLVVIFFGELIKKARIQLAELLCDNLFELRHPVEEIDLEDEVEKALLEAISQSSKGSYVSRAEKSADYRSSGVTFTVFGVLGIIVMILHWAGVFRYFSTVSAVVISVLFLAFVNVTDAMESLQPNISDAAEKLVKSMRPAK